MVVAALVIHLEVAGHPGVLVAVVVVMVEQAALVLLTKVMQVVIVALPLLQTIRVVAVVALVRLVLHQHQVRLTVEMAELALRQALLDHL